MPNVSRMVFHDVVEVLPSDLERITTGHHEKIPSELPPRCSDIELPPRSSDINSRTLSDTEKRSFPRRKPKRVFLGEVGRRFRKSKKVFPWENHGYVRTRDASLSEGSTDTKRSEQRTPRERREAYDSDGKTVAASSLDSLSSKGSVLNDKEVHIIAEDDEDEESLDKFSHRISWLIALLAFQSLSGMILESFEGLIRHHPVVVVFLTMLIGSGGNAGSQSTVLIIRRLATGKLRRRNYLSAFWEQFRVSGAIGAILAAVCFVRVYFFEGDIFEVLAVCVSMGVIVIASIMLGTGLPILFHILRIDPAHANAAVQVLMDIVGVTLTCIVSVIILDRVAPILDPMYLERQSEREKEASRVALRFLSIQ